MTAVLARDRPPSGGAGTALLVGGWTALVLGNWTAGHSLSGAELSAALAEYSAIRPGPALAAAVGHAGRLAALALLGLAAAGAGGPIRAWLAPRGAPAGLPLRAALGAGLIGLGTLGAGLAGLARPAVAWAALAVAALAAVRRLRRPRPPARPGPAATAFGLLAAGAALLALVGALAPEASFDGMAHHLAHPAIYAGAGRVILLPHHFLSHVPALLEMQYLFASLVTGDPEVGKRIHYGWGLLCAAALHRWARASLEPAWALAAVAAFLLMPYVFLVLMWSYVDLGAAAYVTLALHAAAVGAPAVLVGALCGLAAGVKLTGVFAAALAGGVLLARGRGRALPAFAAAFGLAAGAWGAKNLLATGNPFAPFGSGAIPTLQWGPDRHARYVAELDSYAPGHGVPDGLLRLPLTPWAHSIRDAGTLDAKAGMGPWLLWLLPALVLVRVPAATVPALAALGWFALWHLVPRQTRYLLPAWPAACLAAAHAARAVHARGGACRAAVLAGLPLLGFQLLWDVRMQFETANPVRVTFGREPREGYLARGMPGKHRSLAMRAWLRLQPGGGRLLVANQYGLGLFWGPRALVQSFFDEPLIERAARESATPDRIGVRMRQWKIRWVLSDEENAVLMQRIYRIFSFDDASARRWRAWWDAHAVEAHREESGLVLFGVSAGPVRTPPGFVPGLDQQRLADLDGRLERAETRGEGAAALAELADAYREAARATDLPAAWERAGLVLSRLARHHEAAAALREAERRGRRTARASDALGLAAAAGGAIPEAARRFAEAVALDPGYANARRNLVVALLRLGRAAEARAVAAEGLARDPASPLLRDAWRLAGGR